MSFITNWIASSMEDPKLRDERWREHMTTTLERCEYLKELWNRPFRYPKYWREPERNKAFIISRIKMPYMNTYERAIDEIASHKKSVQ